MVYTNITIGGYQVAVSRAPYTPGIKFCFCLRSQSDQCLTMDENTPQMQREQSVIQSAKTSDGQVARDAL